ncbi:tetratricopeptide repeat protein 12 isoform 9-T9 [Alca torda]
MLADREQEEAFQRFLRRVDDIAELVQGLNSTDPDVKEKAITEAEKRLIDQANSKEEESKTVVNRTVINAQASDMANAEAVNADGFLAILEKDAKERAKQRKRNEHLANALKEKGNDAFRKGDYVIAIQRYTEGLEKLKDKQELYTNRAQAYLKMQEYEKAIDDCEWALKCNEKCIKAYFLMGKAHLALKHFNESRQCYEKILQIDPQKESLFKDCTSEVDLEEKRMKDEERAMKEVESGKLAALSVKELLQKLDRPDQNILYYTEGIRLLTGAIKDCTEQTLFRTNNGFSILKDNEVVRWGFCAERKNTAEVDLSVSLLFLWQAVCAGNEENQRLLLTYPDVNAQLPKLLSSGVPEIQKQTLALISLYSENENGRRLLIRHQDLTKWLQILMTLVNSTDARASSAMNILSNLTEEERFKTQCRVMLSTGVLPLFTQLLAGGQITSNYGIKTLSICTRNNRQAQEDLVKSDKKFSVLLKLLESENEKIVGNAAFCLGRCLAVPGAATSLLNSNVVMILLKHAGGDATRTLVQENAAIALGKLCVAEPRHIVQLRKLNGLAILNSSMKYVHST